MACTVRFRSSHDGAALPSVEVAPGTTLLEAVRRAGLPIARACGGGGLCARCGVEVLAGGESLAPAGDAERLAKRANRIPDALRLACQVEVRGPLLVTAGYW
jgi:adenylate cyclase